MVVKCYVRRITAVFLGLLIIMSFSGFWRGSIVHAAGSINVMGRFTFAGGEPVRHAYVEVMDSEVGFDEFLTSGYTDNDGYYTFSGLNNDDGLGQDGRDIYVKVYAWHPGVKVRSNPSWIPTTDWALQPAWLWHVYRFKTSTKENVDDGDVNMGAKDAPSDVDEAFNVFDTTLKGYDFLVSLGLDPGQVTVFWDDWFTPGNSYFMPWSIAERATIPDAWAWLLTLIVPYLVLYDIALEEVLRSLRGIHIKDGDGWEEDTVLHEYGHFVMEKYADFWPPDSELTHVYEQAYNPEHAWVEGWAHFFSAAVRHWAGYPVADYRDNPPIEYPNYQGDSVEAAVAGVLWDIYDSENEADDSLSSGFGRIWHILLNDEAPFWYGDGGRVHPWNIYDFFWSFYTKYPHLITKVYKILDLHGISVPGVQPPPTVEISPNSALLQPGSSVSYTIEVTNEGSETDTFELSLFGLRRARALGLFDTSYDNLLTIEPGQTETITLTVTSSGDASILQEYGFMLEAKSTTPLYMMGFDRATLDFDFSPTLPSTPEGGLAIAIIPKTCYAVFHDYDYPPGDLYIGEISIDVINNQNFDDAIFLELDFTGIPPGYQAQPDWFREYLGLGIIPKLWVGDKIFIPAMSSFSLRLLIVIDDSDYFAGYKFFKVTATSTAWSNGYAQDAGIIELTMEMPLDERT